MVSVSQEMKHETSSKIRGKFRALLRAKYPPLFRGREGEGWKKEGERVPHEGHPSQKRFWTLLREAFLEPSRNFPEGAFPHTQGALKGTELR